MFEFNPDGSIKLPGSMQKKKDMDTNRMTKGFCIKVRKDVVSTYAPKSCKVEIKLSKRFEKKDFVEHIYNHFKLNSQTPAKFTQISDDEFHVEIGSDFRRCSDCENLVGRFRDHVDGNLIEETGTCTRKKREFTYDDYFD